jgi:hypothetical protein
VKDMDNKTPNSEDTSTIRIYTSDTCYVLFVEDVDEIVTEIMRARDTTGGFYFMLYKGTKTWINVDKIVKIEAF